MTSPNSAVPPKALNSQTIAAAITGTFQPTIADVIETMAAIREGGGGGVGESALAKQIATAMTGKPNPTQAELAAAVASWVTQTSLEEQLKKLVETLTGPTLGNGVSAAQLQELIDAIAQKPDATIADVSAAILAGSGVDAAVIQSLLDASLNSAALAQGVIDILGGKPGGGGTLEDVAAVFGNLGQTFQTQIDQAVGAVVDDLQRLVNALAFTDEGTTATLTQAEHGVKLLVQELENQSVRLQEFGEQFSAVGEFITSEVAAAVAGLGGGNPVEFQALINALAGKPDATVEDVQAQFANMGQAIFQAIQSQMKALPAEITLNTDSADDPAVVRIKAHSFVSPINKVDIELLPHAGGNVTVDGKRVLTAKDLEGPFAGENLSPEQILMLNGLMDDVVRINDDVIDLKSSALPKGSPGQILQADDTGSPAWVALPDEKVQPVISSTGGGVGKAKTIPASQWVSYVPGVSAEVVGAWQVDGAVYVVPEGGVYAVSGQVMIVPPSTAKDADIAVRIVVGAGVLAGTTYRVGSSVAVLNLSDSIRLEAGDRVQVQVFTEAGKLGFDPGSLAFSLRKVQEAPKTVRTVWENPPFPFGEQITEATDTKARSIELVVTPVASASWAGLAGVEADSFGGAAVTVNSVAAGAASVINVGANVGRLLKVEGNVAGATRLGLQTANNGYVSANAWNATGKNPGGLQLIPSLFEAKASPTRCTFDGKSGGQQSKPGHIYVRDTRATVSVFGQGADIGGGTLKLTDVTPFDFIGDKLTIKGSKPADATTAIKWESAPQGGIIPTWDQTNGWGRQFAIEALPKGDYRIKGSITVKGKLAGNGYLLLKYGGGLYPGGAAIQPCRIANRPVGSTAEPGDLYPSDMGTTASLTINNFETTYYYDTYFERTSTSWCFMEITNTDGVKGEALDISGELEFRRMDAADPLWWFDLEMKPVTGDGKTFNPVWKNAGASNIGPTLLNAGQSWSNYGAGAGSAADNSGAAFFPQHWNKQPQKWTLDLAVADGGISSASLLNRRVGTNSDSTALQNLGGGKYRVELVIPAGSVDGQIYENFGYSYVVATAGAKVTGTLRVEQTGQWIPLSSAQG